MYKELQIGNKTIGMLANAASPIFYKQIFHEDFLKETQKPDTDSEVIQKMGFVMAMNAQNDVAAMMKLTYQQYIEWLLDFDALDLFLAAGEIMDVYNGSSASSSSPKEKGV